jgi:hypothetical protein
MIRGPLSRRTVFVSRLLNWFCLRYGVAMPSVWLCAQVCKSRQFNGFASDYPHTLACFGLQDLSVLENWDVLTFRAPRSEGSRSVAKLSRSSQSPGNVAGFCHGLSSLGIRCKHCRSSSSRGRPLGTAFPSEHAGWFLSAKRPSHVAARACWLNLQRMSLVEPEEQVRVCSRSARSVGATNHKSTRTERNPSWIKVEEQ